MRSSFRWIIASLFAVPMAWSSAALADCTVPSTPNDGYFDQDWAGTGHGCVVFDGDNRDATATSQVDKLMPAANGSVVLGGDASGVHSGGFWWIGKLTAAGAFDTTFGDSDNSGLMTECQLLAPATCPTDSFFDFAAQADGKVLALSQDYVARTNAGAHALDTSVTGGTGHVVPYFMIATPSATMYASNYGGIATTGSGKVFAAGFGYASFSPNALFGIARLGTDLSLDTTFHNITADTLNYAGGSFIDMGTSAQGTQISETADGHIMMIGYNGYRDVLIARLNSDGTPDTSYGTNGHVAKPTLPSGVVNEGASYHGLVDRVGRALFVIDGYATASGYFGPLVTRFDANGIQDSSFGTNGWAYNNTFTACPNSGVQPTITGYPLAIDSAGRILVIGTCDSGTAFAVMRLRGDTGALDTSFGINGLAHGRFDQTSNSEAGNTIALDGAGHLYIGGNTHPTGKNFQAAVGRLTYDLIWTDNFEVLPRGCSPPDCN